MAGEGASAGARISAQAWRSTEQVRMGTGSLERDSVASDTVDQNPVGPYVAVPVTPPLTLQLVVQVALLQRFLSDEAHHDCLAIFQLVPAPLALLEVPLELGSPR